LENLRVARTEQKQQKNCSHRQIRAKEETTKSGKIQQQASSIKHRHQDHHQKQQSEAAIRSSNQKQQSEAAIRSSNQKQQSEAAIRSRNPKQQSEEVGRRSRKKK
jgi:hypothetical protein